MGEKIICTNRKAHFNYHLLDRIEAGIVLTGSEVKSLREGGGNIGEAYAMMKGNELWLINSHISPYDPAAYLNHKPKRDRKLLLHKKELLRIGQKLAEKGLTLVPTKMYFKAGIAKLELALAKGKQAVDKRETIKKRDVDRELRRTTFKR